MCDPDREFPLCRSCSGISSTAVQAPDGYVLHENTESLISSSRSCKLCRLVRSQLCGVIDRVAVIDSASKLRSIHHSQITLRAHKTRGKIWLHAYRLHLGELQWFTDPGEFLQGLGDFGIALASRADDFCRSVGHNTQYASSLSQNRLGSLSSSCKIR
jgi:hypothetical protein